MDDTPSYVAGTLSVVMRISRRVEVGCGIGTDAGGF
jgi:stage V sporulation protein SpoVS